MAQHRRVRGKVTRIPSAMEKIRAVMKGRSPRRQSSPEVQRLQDKHLEEDLRWKRRWGEGLKQQR